MDDKPMQDNSVEKKDISDVPAMEPRQGLMLWFLTLAGVALLARTSK